MRNESTRCIQSQQDNPLVSSSSKMEQFPEELFTNYVLPFVGENQFRFVASVSRSFYKAYTSVYPKKQTALNCTTIEHAKLCYSDLTCSKAARIRYIMWKKSKSRFGNPLFRPQCVRTKLFVLAAKEGNVNIVKFLHEVGCPWDEDVCSAAAANGHLSLLKCLRALGCPWNERTCVGAAKNGHLDILKWARENECPWDIETCKDAVRNGHLSVLEWAAENGCRVDSAILNLAAEQGRLDMVQWAHRFGCECDERTLCHAAASGNLEVLEWLLENDDILPEWRRSVCTSAAGKGHLEMLQWLRKKDFPWNERTCANAAAQGYHIISNLADRSGAIHSQKYFDVLRFAHKGGCPWDAETCAEAALTDNLELLQYAHERGCPWDERTCRNAAEKGHFRILKYAHEHGCPWDDTICSSAALHGNMSSLVRMVCIIGVDGHEPKAPMQNYRDIVQYAHEHGCPWNENTCANAALANDVELLQYAHENACPWNNRTCLNAVFTGNLSLLKYAHENGCPWDKDVFSIAAERGRLDILQYLFSNGCPWLSELIPTSTTMSMERLLSLHCMGVLCVELPLVSRSELDRLYCSATDSNDVLSSVGVDFNVIVCENVVVRMFINDDMEIVATNPG